MTTPAVEEFPLYGGRPCLNLLATLGKRHATPVERIPDGAAAARWLRLAGVVPDGAAVDVTPGELARLVELREAVFRLVEDGRSGAGLAAADRELVNAVALGPTFAPQFAGAEPAAGVTRAAERPVAAALTALARDAIDLITGGRLHRVKECANPDCSRRFLDESQAGRRRWCSMDRCGNLAKLAGYRGRRRSAVE